jgi:uncharacterized membrane protein YbhN (UPF0104 family)
MTPVADHRTTTARRRAVRIALEVFTIALALYLIAPRIAGFEKVGRAIARGSLVSILALIAFEAASLLSYGELVRVVLRSMGEPATRGLVQRTTLVGTSLGRTLPGGTTTALAVVVNALRRAGFNGVRSTAALATSGLLSSFVLAFLLVPAVVLAMAGGQDGGIALGAAVAAVGIVGFAIALIPAAHRPRVVGNFVEASLRRLVPRALWHHLDPVVAARAARSARAGTESVVRGSELAL